MKTVQGHAVIVPPDDTDQTPDFDDIVQNCGYRMLKASEAKRLMGFGPEYVLLGTQAEQQKQAGNAVPPPNAQMIGQAIAAAAA